MLCEKCGFKNPDDMKFCGQCAHALKLNCPSCRFTNPANFQFCGNCGISLIDGKNLEPNIASPAADISIKHPTYTSGIHSRSDSHAERRQLTVLFCDLVGSSALSEGIDPEDLRDIMNDYRNACDKSIQRYGGHIAQYLGDGILAYFGYPHAHEDDARRAVQSALSLIQSLQCLNQKLIKQQNINLSIRLGIHTGLVVIGDLNGDEKQSLALGVTPNIAARLQDIAEANSVVISSATKRLVDNCFRFKNLNEHQLKGFSQPFHLYQVLGEISNNDTAQHIVKLGLTPLIGREQESALLLDRLSQAKNGMGQAVLLSGEAGIGKSRLTQLIRDQIQSSPHYMLDGWGSPYFENSFLYCIIGILKRAFHLDKDINAELALQKIETPLTAADLPLPETIPLIADLLNIPIEKSHYPPLNLTPLQRKQQTLKSLVSLITAMASQKTVILIIEDLHWIDDTSLELIGMLIDQVPTNNIFLLLTYRMEFSPPWTPKTHLTHISINRLTRNQAGSMVEWLTGNKDLPISVYQQIINKTDGTPFFIEEVTKMVLESGTLTEHAGRYELNTAQSDLAIPTTLQDSLMARLDRLGPEKELAQISATLGREFGHDLLKAVAPRAAGDFEARLSHLVYSELLYQRGLPPHASYTFRHALVHEAAYQSLLKKTRQKYHHRIANILLSKFPNMIQDNPELMAHHCMQAGDHEQAATFWLHAGKVAIARSALTDAIKQLSYGIKCLEKVDSDNKVELEIGLYATLGLAYIMCKGYASNEVVEAYAKAHKLCTQIDKNNRVFPVLYGLWEYYLVRADLDKAHDLAKQLEICAKKSADKQLHLESQRTLGTTHFWLGHMNDAFQYLDRGIQSNRDKPQHSNGMQSLYSQDTQVAILSNIANVLWLQGFPEQALQKSQLATSLATKIEHPFSLAYSYHFSSITFQLSGDIHATKRDAGKVVEIAEQYDFMFWQATGKMLQAWSSMKQTADEQYINQFVEALSIYRQTGSRLALTYFQSLLVDIYLQADEPQHALDTVNTAINEMNNNNERFFEPELFRLKGLVELRLNKSSDVVTKLFSCAIQSAQQHNARGLELRARISLCQLLKNQNNANNHLIELQNVLDRLNEGHSSKDYMLAKQLITSLKKAQPA